MNKKGSIFDVMTNLAVVTAFALSCVIVFHLFAEMKPTLSNSLGTSPSVQTALNSGTNVTLTYDWLIIVVFFGLFLASVVGAFLLRSHPIFFWPLIIVAMLSLIVLVIYNNMWNIVAANTTLNSTIQDNFAKTGYVYGKLPLIGGVLAVVIIIVILAKGQGGSSLV